MEKGHAERSLHALGKDASQTLVQNGDITPRFLNDQKDPERQKCPVQLRMSMWIYSDNNLITFNIAIKHKKIHGSDSRLLTACFS